MTVFFSFAESKGFARCSTKYMEIIEPRHEISNNVVCATSKGLRPSCAYAQSDQTFACRLNIL